MRFFKHRARAYLNDFDLHTIDFCSTHPHTHLYQLEIELVVS